MLSAVLISSNQLIHYQVRAKISDILTSEEHRNGHLRCCFESLGLQRKFERFAVHGLKKTKTEILVDLVEDTNDSVCQIGMFVGEVRRHLFFFSAFQCNQRFQWQGLLIKNSASSRSAGVVILILRGDPMTTHTFSPRRSTSEASSVPMKPSASALAKARWISS